MSGLARTLLISGFISVFVTLPSHAADVYKRVDEQGVPSFSDAKTEGAEVIEVEPVNVQPIPIAPEPTHQPTKPEASFTYSKLEIVSPADETTLRNQQQIILQAAINPSLRSDHRLEFLDNDQVLQTAGENSRIELTDFDRGTHTLSARIIDKNNNILKTSSPITVYIHRNIAPASIAAPRAPTAPMAPKAPMAAPARGVPSP